MKKSRFRPSDLQNVIDFGFTSPEPRHRSPYPQKTDERVNIDPERKLIKFLSFGSGSSGNCSYVGSDEGGMLVDAGINPDSVATTLEANGIAMTDVKGILLTHDHHDHVRYVYKMLRTYRHMHLFCTNRVLKGLMQRHNLSKRIQDYHIAIYKEIPFRILDFEITAFDVPHDGTDNMGFHLSLGEKSIAFATDLGTITTRAAHYLSQANYLILEANYDSDMLRQGTYPEYLKARIRTTYGHLDNADTAAFLAQIMGPQLKYVFLCHLSKDNNTPRIALTTITDALQQKGFTVGSDNETIEDRMADVRVSVLPRFDATRLFVLRE